MGWKMKNVIALFVVLALIYWQQSAFADMTDRTNIEMNKHFEVTNIGANHDLMQLFEEPVSEPVKWMNKL